MRMISPEVEAPQVQIATEQDEFFELTAALVTNAAYGPYVGRWNTVLLAFRPNTAERERIAAGEDLYVALLTGGGPMQPILVRVGKEEASLTFNIKPT